VHPDYAAAYLWRGAAEANQSQLELAEADFQMALKKDPSNASALTQLAQLRLREHKPAETEALLDQALTKDPQSVQALNLYVAYELSVKQAAKALSKVQQLISSSPKSAYLYSYLAGIQLNQKNYAGAKVSSQQAMQLDPSNEDAVQSFSQAEVGLGETGNAIAVWQKWASLHPADAHATLLLGTLEDADGNIEEARQYYKKTLELSPNQPMASNNLAYLMIENGGDADVALSLAQTARRALPDSIDTADTLAWAYYHAGTYVSAKDLLKDATKVDPDNASVHYHLGMTLLKLNAKPDAKVQLAKAVSLAPNTLTAKKAALALTQMQ